MHHDQRLKHLDQFTYGRSPSSVFLVDLLNAEIDRRTVNIERVCRKFGFLYSETAKHLRALSHVGESEAVDLDILVHYMNLEKKHALLAMASLKIEMYELDPRIPNLTSNVLIGQFKALHRRLYKFELALQRQNALQSRLDRGTLALDEDIYDSDTGALLFEDGMLTKLTLRDFDDENDDRVDQLWARAKSQVT